MNTSRIIMEAQWIARECHILFPGSESLSVRQVIAILNLDDTEREVEISQQIEMEKIKELLESMRLDTGTWSNFIDETLFPILVRLPTEEWILISNKNVKGELQGMASSGSVILQELPPGSIFTSVCIAQDHPGLEKKNARALFVHMLSQHKRMFIWAAVAAITGNLLALGGSLYSMQVYDRVMSTHNSSTLIVLMVGALLAALTEFVVKLFRLSVTEYIARTMDIKLSGRIFHELLNIRMDQFPASVGTLATQFRGYETVRVFMTTAVMYFLVDSPFAILFLVIIALIAGPVVASVPVIFIIVSLCVGFFYRNRIAVCAASGHDYSAQRHGYIVETIQNAETIKASGATRTRAAGWHILERDSSSNATKIRSLNEQATYFTAFIQQAAYIMLVSVGAYVAISGETLTSGALIACSILSGRLMTPVAGLPGMILHWANARASFGGVEALFTLEKDNESVKTPLVPETLSGAYQLSNIHFAWPGSPEILRVDNLSIKDGEKVAIIGSIGSGKSTLLKIIAGLYRPTEGLVLLDNMDIQQISRSRLSESIGYCPQETRLIAGSLRDNLTAGQPGYSEASLHQACHLTGLNKIISGHPRGFDREFSEGGSGLSGGQKQLVTLTRILLSSPDIWLLDEPTSAMDDASERLCIESLKTSVKPSQTLIIVTHKPALLALVQRIIVLGPSGSVVVDGPKDEVLRRLTPAPKPESTTAINKVKPVVTAINIVNKQMGDRQ